MDLDWIRDGLTRPGKTQRGLAAALGIDPSAVSRLLTGRRRLRADEIVAVADYLGVRPPLEAFAGPPRPRGRAGGGAGGGAAESDAAPLRYSPAVAGGPRDLPVLGVAVAGSDGLFVMNGEPQAHIERPSVLAGVARAYAVYIADSSMEPRYFPGETAYVNPALPPRNGDFVIVQLRPAVEGEAPKALCKRLVRRTPSMLVISQLNPAREIEFALDRIESIHVIVLAGRG
ncbi:MAG: helix-turn-helix transcriptional regulator [Alphaproteobacteria bacterium]